jgi:hypothetical protein
VLNYKILNDHISTQIKTTFTRYDFARTRGHDLKLFKSYCSVDAKKIFFSNRIINVWNALPSDVVPSQSSSAFKKLLSVLNVSYSLVGYNRVSLKQLPDFSTPTQAIEC